MSLKLRQVWSPPSLFSLQELAAASEQFDMVFIDADKTNYINYYNFILDNNLLRLWGVMCVDNSLFKAKVYLQETTDENGLALREFNQFVASDPRVEQVTIKPGKVFFAKTWVFVWDVKCLSCLKVLIPLRDGLSLIRRVSVTSTCSRTEVGIKNQGRNSNTTSIVF